MSIRERIRQVLEEHPDWTPRSVSLRAGLSDSMLTKFLNPDKRGGVKSITLDTLDKLAEALEVNPRWLAYGDLPKTRDPKVAHIFDRIKERDHARVLRILESFIDEDEQTG